MTLRNSLRWRVTTAFALSGALLSALFALMAHLWGHDIELRFIDATMGEQLRYIIALDQQQRVAFQPTTATMQGYAKSLGDEHELPVYLRGLLPGIYERQHAGREYHIVVEDRGVRRYYLTFDATRLEPFEALFHNFLIGGIIGFTLLTLGLGYALSARIMAPVVRLAEQLKSAPPDEDPALDLADAGNDEVADLARTFDAYAKRLRHFRHREDAFTAQMSHELRNYLFVIRSTAELLAADSAADAPHHARLQRIQHAIDEMGSLLDAIFILAREVEPAEAAPTTIPNVEEILREVLDSRQLDLTRKNIHVQLQIEGTPKVEAPPPVVRALFCELIDKFIAQALDGQITIAVNDDAVIVRESGTRRVARDLDFTTEDPNSLKETYRQIEDTGTLSLVTRICERYDWKLETSPRNDDQSQARLLFQH